MKRKIHVAVVYNEPVTSSSATKVVTEAGVLQEGGKPARRSMTGQSVDLSEVGVLEEREDIARALQADGYKCSLFNVDSDIPRLINFLNTEQPDVIFNLCESVNNIAIHEMHVVGIYELLGIPYTGSDALVLGTALNKVRVKQLLMLNNLPTPRFQYFTSPIRLTLDENLNFPLIVKPSREDASIGIETSSVVRNLAELKKRVRYIFEYFDQPALVEEYIDGRELNVAVLGNRKRIAFPISEIDMSTMPAQYHRIVTYNAKWMKGTDEYEHTRGVCPAPLPVDLETRIKELALQAVAIIGCRDYCRVDFRLSKDNQPYILEVNPNPDISDEAGFSRSARAYGLEFNALVSKIIECALERTP